MCLEKLTCAFTSNTTNTNTIHTEETNYSQVIIIKRNEINTEPTTKHLDSIENGFTHTRKKGLEVQRKDKGKPMNAKAGIIIQ